MKTLRNLKAIILIILPVLILVIIRLLSPGHFSSGMKEQALPSLTRSNIITKDNAAGLGGNQLLVSLGSKRVRNEEFPSLKISVSPDSLLSGQNLRRIMKHNGPVILSSDDAGLSSRIWMLLSQMGRKDLYILDNDTMNEMSQNKFRPDSLFRPEIDTSEN
jgi:hypothetical protein